MVLLSLPLAEKGAPAFCPLPLYLHSLPLGSRCPLHVTPMESYRLQTPTR